MTDTMAGEGVRMFGPEVENVQSRYIIVHQLRASADIQSEEVTRHMGRKATTDRASLMREAADLIEALAAQPSAGAQEIVWVRSGADVNGDPLTLKTTFGDMDVNVVKSRGTGLWNVSGYILGKMGIATEAEAVAYAEDRLRSDADRRVRAAHKAITLYATPAQPDTGDVAALREAQLEADMERDLTESDQEAIERSLRIVQAFVAVRDLRSVLSDTMARQHSGYDWNADPDGMTIRQSYAVKEADAILAALSKPNAPGAPEDGGA